jgi:hypothetical protein
VRGSLPPSVAIAREPAADLAGYAEVPIAYEVRSRMEVARRDGALVLTERTIATPYAAL